MNKKKQFFSSDSRYIARTHKMRVKRLWVYWCHTTRQHLLYENWSIRRRTIEFEREDVPNIRSKYLSSIYGAQSLRIWGGAWVRRCLYIFVHVRLIPISFGLFPHFRPTIEVDIPWKPSRGGGLTNEFQLAVKTTKTTQSIANVSWSISACRYLLDRLMRRLSLWEYSSICTNHQGKYRVSAFLDENYWIN